MKSHFMISILMLIVTATTLILQLFNYIESNNDIARLIYIICLAVSMYFIGFNNGISKGFDRKV